MWRELFRHTLAHQIRRPGFLILCAACFLLGACFASYPTSYFIAPSSVLNAPVNIAAVLGVLSGLISLFCVTLLVGPVLRDWDLRFFPILLARPVSAPAYLAGRFGASVLVLHLLLLCALGGLLAAPVMPWVHEHNAVTPSLQAVVWTFAVFVFPNALFACAIAFFWAVNTKSLRATYFGVIGVWLIWLFSGAWGRSALGLLLDPFGIRALFQTVIADHAMAERATLMPSLSWMLQLNRTIWLSASVVLLLVSFLRFRRTCTSESSSEGLLGQATRHRPRRIDGAAFLPAWPWLTLVWHDARFVLRSLPALASVALALFFLCGDLVQLDDPFALATLPVTGRLLDAQAGSMQVVIALLVAFMAGELVHRDAAVRIDGITHALPVAPLARMTAKVVALLVAITLWQLLGAVLALGYAYSYDTAVMPGDYVMGVAAQGLPLCLLALASVALQYASGRKYLGLALTAVLGLTHVLTPRGLDLAPLLRFADLPALHHSDVAGFGDQLVHWLGYAAYWALLTAALAALALAFAARRRHTLLGEYALASLWRPMAIAGGGASLASVAACALMMQCEPARFDHAARLARTQAAARHEQRYAAFLHQAQPQIAHASLQLEFAPTQRKVSVTGQLHLKNSAAQPIDKILLDFPDDTHFSLTQTPDLASADEIVDGATILRLRQPLLPGETVQIGFRGETTSDSLAGVPGAGPLQARSAFVASEQVLPCIGYDTSKDLEDPEQRAAQGLGAIDAHRMEGLPLQSLLGCGRGDASLEATLVAPAGMQALTSGELVQADADGARSRHHYRSQRAQPAFWGFAWGVWEEQRVRAGDINVRLLADAQHAYNRAALLDVAKRSLETFQALYGPYPYPTYSIVEVPRFVGGPRSFPGMAIVPESVGFIADYAHPQLLSPFAGSFDQAQWAIAHEVAHQWWGLQLVPTRAPGSQFLSESLAQYATLRQLQGRKDADARLPLERALQDYLAARNQSSRSESPLSTIGDEPDVAYRKGLLVLAGAGRLLGAATLDGVLRDWYVRHNDIRDQPVLASALIAAIVDAAPANTQAFLSRSFTTTAITEARLQAATVAQQAGGSWKVQAQIQIGEPPASVPAYAVPLTVQLMAQDPDQPMGKPRALRAQQFELPAGVTTISLSTPTRPDSVQLDPDHLLLDPTQDDHEVPVAPAISD